MSQEARKLQDEVEGLRQEANDLVDEIFNLRETRDTVIKSLVEMKNGLERLIARYKVGVKLQRG